MNDEIISQIYSVKSSTIGDIKGLLHDIKHHKTQSLESRIRELEGELKKLKKSKRYGLVWEDKPEDVVERCKSELPLLKEVTSRRIQKTDDDLHHILIEGDNFHALSTLAYTHAGKIDVIYIDPPYNTLKDGFTYNDKMVDENDPFRHTKWISFIQKRIILARKLLSEKGAIFLSIDDNEQAQLKLLCDEIFGENNNIIVSAINRPSEIATGTSILKHEYMLGYAKNITKFQVNGIEKYTISRGTVGNIDQTQPIITFPKGLPCYNLKDGIYNETRKIEGSTENIENLDPIIVKDGFLDCEVRLKARWRSSNDMRNFFNNDCEPTIAKINGIIEEIYFENDKFNPQIKKKTYEKLNSLVLNNTRGSKDLEDLGLKGKFKYPKSKKLIADIFRIIGTKNTIILDFFAGSGTTGHAVLELNKEDGGNRQFILCTNNENKIAEEVTYPRIRNVIEGYSDVAGIPANLRYYKTEFIGVEKSLDDLRYKFMGLCDELLCIKENTFEEVKLKIPSGISPFEKGSTRNEVEGEGLLKLFKNSKKSLVILYDIHHFDACVKLLKTLNIPVKVYVFSLAREIYEEELSYIGNHIEVANIPDDILETYKKIFHF